jgi:cobalt-zinc-cadmium efflux system membrane fusion protein
MLSAIVLLTQCRHDSNNDQNEASSAPLKVSLTQEQMKLAGLEFGRLEKHMLSGDIDARGEIVLPPTNDAIITPVLGGIVHEIRVMQGDVVKKGTVLANLSHPDYIKLQEEYLQVVTNIEYLSNEYERQKRLYDEKVSSEKKFLQAETDYIVAGAKEKSLSMMLKQLGLDPEKVKQGEFYQYIPVMSPMDGIVDAVLTKTGTNVDATQPLFEVVCRKSLYVELNIFERDIMKIKKGQRVSFRLSNIDVHEYEAKIIATGGSVNALGRVVKVLAEFENWDENLLPGMFVSAEIHTGEQSYDALPENAIMNFGSNLPYFYYTLDKPDAPSMTFDKIFVSTGFQEEGYVQVTLKNELPPAAIVVTNGGYYINAEELKGQE